MNKKKENRPSVREAQIMVPMSQDLRNAIEKAADRNEISKSGFVRLAVLDYLKKCE